MLVFLLQQNNEMYSASLLVFLLWFAWKSVLRVLCCNDSVLLFPYLTNARISRKWEEESNWQPWVGMRCLCLLEEFAELGFYVGFELPTLVLPGWASVQCLRTIGLRGEALLHGQPVRMGPAAAFALLGTEVQSTPLAPFPGALWDEHSWYF